MQLAVRLAATLLALTWITSVAQAATVLRNFTLIGGTVRRKVQPEMARVYTGDLPLRMPAEISKAIIDQAHEHKLRAIAHIFYPDNASFTHTTLPLLDDPFSIAPLRLSRTRC